MLRKLMIVSTGWIVIFVICWNVVSMIYNTIHIQPPEVNLSDLNTEQESLRDTFIAEKKILVPKQFPIPETDEYYFLHPDGSLSKQETESLAFSAIIDTPSWIFWEEDQITYERYDILASLLMFGIFAGLAVGVISEHPFRGGLFVGPIVGLMIVINSGFVVGFIFALSATVGFGFIQLLKYITVKYWERPVPTST